MTDIDELMDRDPLDLSKQDIDRIIEYNRKLLVMYEAGVKPEKDSAPDIDVEKLGLIKPKPKELVRRA